MVRLPGFGRQQPRVEPTQPHRFRDIDPGLAMMASGGMGARGMTGPTQLLVTDNFVRMSNCGVPGCGKPRHDPIHEAADE